MQPKEIYGIQVLRGLAALAVVFHHALEVSNGSSGRFAPEWLTTSGAAGVDVFFVISGFIMLYTAFPANRPAMAPLAFARRRIVRIYPLYWVCLAAMFAIMAAGFLKNNPVSLGQILRSTVLWPGDPVLVVSWTLSYEMLFYFVFALALTQHTKQRAVWFAIVAITALLALGQVANASFLGNPIVLEFCFGILIGLLAANMPTQPSRLLVIVAVGAMILAPIFVQHRDTSGLDGWPRLFFWGVPAAVVVLANLRMKPLPGFGGTFALRLGEASYSIYLTHMFVMIPYGWLIKHSPVGDMPQLGFVLLTTMLSIALGIATYVAIENPMNLALKSRRPTVRAVS